MSQRNFKYLHDSRIIYGRTPITDLPTESTDTYDYYEQGTYQCYALFRSKAKITTYKSLKWHFLVIQHLNGDLTMKELKRVFEYIANVKNNFVVFYRSWSREIQSNNISALQEKFRSPLGLRYHRGILIFTHREMDKRS